MVPERVAGDLDALAVLFLANAAQRMEKQVAELSPGAREKLRSYSWPGNVRELENVLERAAILADGKENGSTLAWATTQRGKKATAASTVPNLLIHGPRVFLFIVN